MKKTCLLAVLLAIFMTGCAQVQTESKPTQGIDYRITPSEVYELDQEKQISSIDSDTEMAQDITLDAFISGEEIIVCTVENVTYTSVGDGFPWMQLDVCVDTVYKGKFQQGDQISVYVSGGYIPMQVHIDDSHLGPFFSDVSEEEAANTIMEFKYDFKEFPKAGDTYLLAVKEPLHFPSIPEGAYIMWAETAGTMFVPQEDGSFLCDVNGLHFTEAELTNAIATVPEVTQGAYLEE